MDKMDQSAHQGTSDPGILAGAGEAGDSQSHGNDLNLGTGEAVESAGARRADPAGTTPDTAIGFDDTGTSRTGSDDAGATGYADSAGLGADETPVS